MSDAAELRAALADARAGQVISVAPGEYRGNFTIGRSGTPQRPSWLCGAPGAVLNGGSSGYTLHLDGSQWWRVVGLDVTGGQKGVVLDGASNVTLADLHVSQTQQEAVHLRTGSSDNRLTALRIDSTGLGDPRFGEGVYVGSASSNWCRYSDCQPDRSDRNSITDSEFGPGIRAEAIDIKEGTSGGDVERNRFDGAGTTDVDSWLDVKGNDWVITGNTGHKAPFDGMQVHVEAPGWGRGNVLRGNHMDVDAPGFGIRVAEGATGTVVGCSNSATGAGSGLSNIPCS